ncbi:MFS transporter [Lottiidibacillus patelloidae]|uniref:MFS transporter n=2 Tax=Lottiidibacillus patelloidae TaxID=2670334 RepID=A0A263BUV1_9BACI|nr:MFS transporter [Lottiidibacillus patelloidae]
MKGHRSLGFLLLIGGLYSLSVALSNTFVNVYLWKQSKEFFDIAIYNLSSVILQPIAFILAGMLAKHIDRIYVLRIGIIFLSAFFLSVLLLGTSSTDFIVILGALHGIGFGVYWLAYNVLSFEITEPDTRDFFNGFSGVLGSFAGIVGPITAGLFITRMELNKGYYLIFTISLIMFALAVFLSFFIKKRDARGSFKLKEVLNERKRNKNWKNILHANFFQGFRGGTFVFLIGLWVYITTESELSLGTFALIQSAISLVAFSLAGKLIKPKNRVKSILFAGATMYIAILIIAFHLTFIKLLIYGVIIAFAFPFLIVPFMSITYDVIGEANNSGNKRIEFLVVRDVYLNLGRVVSILFFIVAISFFSPEKSIPYLLFLIGPGFLIISFFIRKVNIDSTNDKN